jgi:hypothetical protein
MRWGHHADAVMAAIADRSPWVTNPAIQWFDPTAKLSKNGDVSSLM